MTPRWVGFALLAMMPVHVALRPEHGWILLAACDVVGGVTAIGVVFRRPRVVAIAGLFAVAVGGPALVAGALTTYPMNPTGIVLHVAPVIIGAHTIVHHGLPRRAALTAWLVYVVLVITSMVVIPARLNVNMVHRTWRPLADVFTIPGTFQLSLIAFVGLLLWLGEAIIRRGLGRQVPSRGQ
jgi:hypothetical protein